MKSTNLLINTQFATLSETLFYPAIFLTSISITLSNIRVTAFSSRFWRVAHLAFLVLLSTVLIAIEFTTLLQCTPPTTQYSLLALGTPSYSPRCLRPSTLYTALGTIHSILAAALLILSALSLHRLGAFTRSEIRLIPLYLIGSLSCIGSILRPIFLNRDGRNLDVIRAYTQQSICSAISIFFALLASSLPVLNNLPKRWRGESGAVDSLPPVGLAILHASQRRRRSDRSNIFIKEGVHGRLTMESIRELELDAFAQMTEKGSNVDEALTTPRQARLTRSYGKEKGANFPCT